VIKSGKDTVKKVLNIILIVIVAICLFQGVLSITYANADLNKPDVTVTVDEQGRTVCEGDLLGNELWYPGKEYNGVIRVYNNYKSLILKDLNVNVTLKNSEYGMGYDLVYDSFLENMKLTIKKGKLLIFNETLFKDRSFLQLMKANNGNTDENYSTMRSFRLTNGDFIDLNYILHMDEKSGDELENLTASVEVQLNLGDDIEE
jgi:hypothetical protein